VDARHIAEIDPIARKFERWTWTHIHAEHVAIEVAGGIDIVGEDE
jgi:hypothetical protein